MKRDRQRSERYDASTSTYLIMQITDGDHESQVTLEDGEAFFRARLRHARVHRYVEAQKGFKCEWATLHGDELIVGSHGKVRHEEWIKRLGPRGYTVRSVDWSEAHWRMREACGVGEPACVVREAAEWHPHRGRWYFFPRTVSTDPFPRADRRAREGQQPADRRRCVFQAHRGPPDRLTGARARAVLDQAGAGPSGRVHLHEVSGNRRHDRELDRCRGLGGNLMARRRSLATSSARGSRSSDALPEHTGRRIQAR